MRRKLCRYPYLAILVESPATRKWWARWFLWGLSLLIYVFCVHFRNQKQLCWDPKGKSVPFWVTIGRHRCDITQWLNPGCILKRTFRTSGVFAILGACTFPVCYLQLPCGQSPCNQTTYRACVEGPGGARRSLAQDGSSELAGTSGPMLRVSLFLRVEGLSRSTHKIDGFFGGTCSSRSTRAVPSTGRVASAFIYNSPIAHAPLAGEWSSTGHPTHIHIHSRPRWRLGLTRGIKNEFEGQLMKGKSLQAVVDASDPSGSPWVSQERARASLS